MRGNDFRRRNIRFFRLFAGACLLMGSAAAQERPLAGPAEPDTPFLRTLQTRMSTRQFADRTVEPGVWSWMMQHAAHAWQGESPGLLVAELGGRLFTINMETGERIPWNGTLPDLRMYKAPVSVYLMPRNEDDPDGDRVWLWRGMTGQALYLGAAAWGLGTVTVRGIGFPLGYPADEMDFRPAAGIRRVPDESPVIDLRYADAVRLQPEKEADAGPDSNLMPRLLWSAYGYSGLMDGSGKIHRTVPSARGRYPMAVVSVTPEQTALYLPGQDTLQILQNKDVRKILAKETGLPWIGESRACVLLFWNPERLSSRGSALYEAGAMIYNARLMAAVHGQAWIWDAVEREGDWTAVTGDSLEAYIPLAVMGIPPVRPDLPAPEASYKDGVYEGRDEAWPGVALEVVIRNGRISDLRIQENRSTPEFWERAWSVLRDHILASNSVDIDAVSGATLSSENVKRAVRMALEKAK